MGRNVTCARSCTAPGTPSTQNAPVLALRHVDEVDHDHVAEPQLRRHLRRRRDAHRERGACFRRTGRPALPTAVAPRRWITRCRAGRARSARRARSPRRRSHRATERVPNLAFFEFYVVEPVVAGAWAGRRLNLFGAASNSSPGDRLGGARPAQVLPMASRAPGHAGARPLAEQVPHGDLLVVAASSSPARIDGRAAGRHGGRRGRPPGSPRRAGYVRGQHLLDTPAAPCA